MKTFAYFILIFFSAAYSVQSATLPEANLITQSSQTISNASTPRLSSLSDGLLLSWVKKTADGTSLHYAIFRNNRWGNSNTVISGKDWFINYADYARVSILRKA